MAAVLATEPRKISELVPMTPRDARVGRAALPREGSGRALAECARRRAAVQWLGDHPAAGAVVGCDPDAGHHLVPRCSAVSRSASPLTGLLPPHGSGCRRDRPLRQRLRSVDGRESLAAGLQTPRSLLAGVQRAIALSPDGRTVAFAGATDNGPGDFSTGPLDRFDAVKIAGTEGGTGPFFSPNGDVDRVSRSTGNSRRFPSPAALAVFDLRRARPPRQCLAGGRHDCLFT